MRRILRATIVLCVLTGAAYARNQDGLKDASCLSNLKQLGLATVMYCQDWDNKLPPMRTPAGLRKALQPYVRNASLFSCPATNAPYLPVAALSGKVVTSIKSTGTTVAIRDARPHPNGMRGVAYVDGRAKLLPKKPAGKK